MHAKPQVAIVIVVHTLILTHYQGMHLQYSFVANFAYQLICELWLIAVFSTVGMRIGLYASIYGSHVCEWNLTTFYFMHNETLHSYESIHRPTKYHKISKVFIVKCYQWPRMTDQPHCNIWNSVGIFMSNSFKWKRTIIASNDSTKSYQHLQH